MSSIIPVPGNQFQPGVSEGLFDLDFPTYKADPAINAGALKQISRSMRFWEASRRQPDDPTPDMILGQILHLSVLESQNFGNGVSHYIRPDTYMAERLQCPECESIGTGEKCSKCKVERIATQVEQDWNGNSKTCRQWLLDHADKPIISPDMAERAARMYRAIFDEPKAASFIKNSHTEVSAFTTDPETGQRLKARFDMLAIAEDAYIIGDFKKCEDSDNEHAVGRYFAKRQVHLQLAFYGHILRVITEGYSIPFPIRLLAGMIEDSIAPELMWWEMDDASVSAGNDAWRKALGRYVTTKKSGTTPGYDQSQGVRKLSLPRYILNGDGE